MSNRILYSMLYDMLEQDHEAFKTDDGVAILSPKAPLWLWLAQGRTVDDARLFFSSFLHKNDQRLKTEPLVGLVAEEETAMACASLYAKQTGYSYSVGELVAYYLPQEAELEKPTAKGELRPASLEDFPLIQEWLQAFYAETLHAALPQIEQNDGHSPTPDAKARLFIWQDDQPAAMGMLTGSTDQTCRLNLIFAPPDLRGKGYGKAMVSTLTGIIRDNGQIPVLYTASDNEVSNSLYQSLNFQEAGRLTEVRFFES